MLDIRFMRQNREAVLAAMEALGATDAPVLEALEKDERRRSILTQHKVWMWPAIFLMCTVGHAAEFMTTNTMVNWMFHLSWQYWVPTLPYWIMIDTVIILASTIVGVGVLSGLKKARLPQFSDSIEK